MLMKILGGDWPAGHNAALKRAHFTLRIEGVQLWRSALSSDVMPLDQIESVDLVTQENKTSVLGKAGWGAVGAIALGPLGLLAGVLGGGNKSMMIMAVKFKNGRKVLLQGKSKDMQPLLGAAFTSS